MNKIVLSLAFFVLLGCDFDDNGGFYKINCSNLSEMNVKNYPKEIDSLIQKQLNDFYKKDSLNFEIMGHVFNDLNLKNCKIDTSVLNAQVRVKIGDKYDYWRISYKKIDGKYKNEVFFKRKE